MQIKRVFLCTLMGVTLLSGQAFAATSNTTTTNLSLSEAIKLATTDDPELKLMDDKIALEEKSLKQVKANAAYQATETFYDKSEYVSNQKAAYLTPLKKENSVAALKRDKVSSYNTIVLNTMTQYYDVQSKQDALADAKRSLETLSKEIAIKAKELAIGKITQLDYNTYEIKKLEAESALRKAEIDLNTSYIKFANQTNQALSFKFNPVKLSTSVSAYEVKDVNAAIQNEIAKSDDILTKQESIAAMELEIKINLESNYEIGNVDSATNVLQEDLKAAKQDLVNLKDSVELNFKLDHLKLQSSYDSILIAKSSLDLAQKELDVAKVKYGVGTLSLMDYITKQEALDDAEAKYSSSVTDYLLAVEKFKMNHYTE